MGAGGIRWGTVGLTSAPLPVTQGGCAGGGGFDAREACAPSLGVSLLPRAPPWGGHVHLPPAPASVCTRETPPVPTSPIPDRAGAQERAQRSPGDEVSEGRPQLWLSVWGQEARPASCCSPAG